MSLNYFEVGKGLAVFNETSGNYVVVTNGSGTAAINNSPISEFPIGSVYTDTVTGKVYTRTGSTGVGIADWGVSATEAYVASQLSVSASWREPVLVADHTAWASIAAAAASANTVGGGLDKIDGVVISAGKRLLFTSPVTGNKNVYIVSGTSGSWVFTEDANTATTGDTVFVASGTDAGRSMTYSSAGAWVISNESSASEIGYIQNFIGKSAGNETPSYISTLNLAPASNLELAIGTLDSIIGNRTYVSPVVILTGQTIVDSLVALDNQFGTGLITNTVGNYPLTEQSKWNGGNATLTTMFNNLNNSVGQRNYTGVPVVIYTTNGSAINNTIISAEPISTSIQKLAAIAGTNAIQEDKKTTSTTATSAISVSSVTVNSIAADVKWSLVVREHGSPTRVESMEIHALYDGASGVDFSVYSKQRTGTAVAGLVVTVVKSGNELQLQVKATNAINYIAQRTQTMTFG